MPRWQQNTLWTLACLLPILVGAAYVWQFAMSFPRWDQFETTIQAVEGALDGTLTPAILTQPNYGHRIVLPLLTSAALAPLTNWNLIVEAFFGYGLLVVAYIALARTLWTVQVPRPWLAAFVISALVFSLRQRTNLIWSFNSLQWFYMEMFIALAGWAFITRRVGVAGLALTAAFTAAAMLASGGGVALLVVFPLLFWFRGYRSWWAWGAWAVFTGLALWLYTYGQTPGEDSVSPLLIKPVDNFWFLVTWLSSAFISHPAVTPPAIHLMVAVAGVGLLAANTVWIARRQGWASPGVTWLGFLAGYALVAGGMTMLGRSDIWWAGAQSRFHSMSVFFWVAVAVSAVMMLGAGGRWRQANGAALVLLVLGQAAMAGVQFTTPRPEGFVGNLVRERDERCYWVYLIDRSPTCLDTLDRWGIDRLVPQWENLFERRLTLYAAYDDLNPIDALMPDIYRAGERVVISGPQPYQQVRGVTFRDWPVRSRLQVFPPYDPFMARVPPGEVVRIMATDVTANPALFDAIMLPGTPPPPDTAALDRFREALRFQPRVWYMRASAPPAFDAPYRDLLQAGFDPVPVEGVTWHTTGYQDVTLWLREPTEVLRFGPGFVLEDWRMNTPAERTPCQGIEVETMWRAVQRLPENYTLALVLADENGVGQARLDAPPAGYLPQVLEPDVHYAGANTLELPCELPAGDYNLLLGVYQPGTGQALPARTPDGTPTGDLVYLATIRVG